MTPERWREIQDVFAVAVETPHETREQTLRALCAGDEALYREVESLLAADSGASAMLGLPADALQLATPEPSVPVNVRLGEYEIRGLLGRGGMGTVYAGVHPVIGKEVAIKVLDPRLASSDGIVERFVREARAVNRIRHPNIIDIFAFGCSPELGHYFVMPRLIGETLGARVDRAPLSSGELLPIVEQITDALDAAHAAGVLHRDLKPDNVFLVADRRGGVNVQILDFGIAKLVDGEASVTRSGTQIGTPLFMSPEQWDAGDVDRRTDVYALGVMVHYALTGRYPFESSSPVALMNMHANHRPTPASEHGAPAAVDAVIGTALAKSREDRQPTAGTFHGELAAALAGLSDPAVASPAGKRAVPPVTTLSGSAQSLDRPPPGRGRVLLGAGVVSVVAIALVVVALVLSRRGDRSPAPANANAPVAAPDAAQIDAPAPAAIDATLVPAPPVARDAAPRPVLQDARPARPRLPADAARQAPRDAAVTAPPARDAGVPVPPARDAAVKDAGGWGTTINPFPDPP